MTSPTGTESRPQHLAVLTSGGDAPGMNAAVRAVARTAFERGVAISGVMRGLQGVYEGDFVPLPPRSVANILQRGGTKLLTARSQVWMTPEGRAQGAQRLRDAGIDALVVVGGDGSFRGASLLAEEHGVAVMGVPGTIDNDLYGTDHTVGYFTAVQTALDAVDRLRDTAASHERAFVVEVMGRHAGHIALEVALAGGAEDVFLPELPRDPAEAAAVIQRSMRSDKASSVIVVAEGHPGGGEAVSRAIEEHAGIETRVSILGHIQRGGNPVWSDRVLASRLGEAAVLRLLAGERGVMVGMVGGEVVSTPLRDTWERRKGVSRDAYECLMRLSV